ncbi:Sorting and assembly machinery component 50 -like protein B [Sarcoptes scabiei]|uniref:Sorting and assembly machinery component 50 -like protein B n=1 Tax=Sarcoptes scabiei TaxID=52283 RepID=A0A132ADL5_SARSC|nr:Sorting and assembly machinery component 50 -like protein B [Sarcoptes scabiei]KPM09074.1 hypothetical protein QR98_0076040 [Sarcoptes scabiei]
MQLSKYCPWSGHNEVNRNLQTTLKIQPNLRHLHQFQCETSWRYLTAISESTNVDFEIVEQFGHSLKTSLSHHYTYDNRDCSVMPSRGTLIKTINEYAGFQRNGVSFLKHEIQLQHNLSSFLQLSLKGGILKNFNNVTVSDKFFLGGPLNLRGFEMFGVGPHGDQNFSSLGANKYWTGALHLYCPLPLSNSSLDRLLQLHAFINTGSISNKLEDLYQKSNLRLSYGAGLVCTVGRYARLELNYSLPIWFNQKSDKLHKGIQFGIGLSYV